MLRVTLKGVRGHLVRFLLTAFAVMLGVSFVAGTFVLSDSINTTLNGLFTQALKGVDVHVRGVDAKTQNQGGSSRAALPLSLETSLTNVPGVARVAADIQGVAIIAGKDGTAVRNGGAPGLGFAFRADDPAFSLINGTAPTGPDQVVVESSTLEKAQLAVGDSTTAVVGEQTRRVTITGEVEFGSLFGATAVLFDEATARAAFAPDGQTQTFSVTAEPGVTQAALQAEVAKVLPATAEAITGAQLESESQSALKTGLGFFTTFLLAFAGIALFVGAFIIVNTFSMLVAQRTRELALLRAIGASRGQILRVVLGEALVVGLVGSALGLGLGLVIAAGAKAAIKAFLGADTGADLPIESRTIVWSLIVGTLVTVASALLPARRAARIAPVTAMRDDLTIIPPKGLRVRGAVGLSILALGAALLSVSVTRSSIPWGLAGLGAGLAVIGLLGAAPVTARPVVRLISWPFVLAGGVTGKLAQENTLRVPRRTATTASALMIGLALISGVSVLAQSVKASIADIVAGQLTSDFVLSAGNSALPASVAPAVAKLASVQSAATVSGVGVKVGDVSVFGQATTGTGLQDNFVVDMVSGDLSMLDDGKVLVSQTAADDYGWTPGKVLNASVGTLTGQSLVVGGVFEDNQALSTPVLLGRAIYEQAVPAGQRADFGVYVKAKPGTDLTALRTELTAIAEPFLIVSVQDGTEFTDAAASTVDTLLNLLYVLLLFSVIVAVLGIINTLALSVFERTREIGLLRAVGLSRRQLSGMITLEAVATALFGAVLGTVLGLGLGIALQRGLVSQGLDTLAIPWGTIVTVLIASALVGVLAATLPAIRAVRLNILKAIATD